jgi:hypothetical protein
MRAVLFGNLMVSLDISTELFYKFKLIDSVMGDSGADQRGSRCLSCSKDGLRLLQGDNPSEESLSSRDGPDVVSLASGSQC